MTEMKTITYNPETHVLVPRDLIADAKQIFCSDVKPNTNGDCLDVIEWFNAMMAVAPQPESVDVEPTAYLSIDSIGERYLCFSKPADNDSCYPLYTTPQPDRVAELEAETTKLKLDLLTSYGEAEELLGKVAELEAALKEADAELLKLRKVEEAAELARATDQVIHAEFHCEADGISGTTAVPVKSISRNDDGSYTVRLDYWPESTMGKDVVEPLDLSTLDGLAVQDSTEKSCFDPEYGLRKFVKEEV